MKKTTAHIIMALLLIRGAAFGREAPDHLYLRNQGLTVTTNSRDVEIFINGISYGKSESITVRLPTGIYRIEGKKENHFSDYEMEQVERGSIDRISLTAKKVRIQISPRTGLLLRDGKLLAPVISLEAGVKTVNHYWGAFFMAHEGFADEDTVSSIIIAGITHNFINFESKNVIFEMGSALAYSRTRRYRAYSYPYEETQEFEKIDETLLAGPRGTLQVGLDHIKFIITLKYFLLCDEKLTLFDKRNTVAVLWGAAFAF